MWSDKFNASSVQFEIDQEMQHRVVLAYVGGMAKSGCSDLPDATEQYLDRKFRQGANRLGELGQIERDVWLASPQMRCECCQVGKTKSGQCRWEIDKQCPMCRGSGRRISTAREREHLDRWFATQLEQLEREARGNECCSDYVVESTEFNARHGAWHPEELGDGYGGYHFDAASFLHMQHANPDVPQAKPMTVKVKRYSRGGQLLEEVEEVVPVTPLYKRSNEKERAARKLQMEDRARSEFPGACLVADQIGNKHGDDIMAYLSRKVSRQPQLRVSDVQVAIDADL